MEFVQIPALLVYFGTPVFIVWWWTRPAVSGGLRPLWPVLAALGLWLLQAGVLLYSIAICLSGHCRPTPLEEQGPVVLLLIAYLAIGWLLWVMWKPRHYVRAS